MPHVTTDDKQRLYYEEAGSGFPVVFVHEFAGDCRSWEPQIRYFLRHYRCVAFNARGYPPSAVPKDVAGYSQGRAVEDIVSVCGALGIAKAHVVGLSMGGFATLHFAMRRPDLVRSAVIAGCGYGAEPERQATFRRDCEAAARRFEELGSAKAAAAYADVPARWPLRDKDPRGWAEFCARLAEHDALGAANTLRGVQTRRPSLWDLVEDLRRMRVPALIVNGDADEQCLLPGLLMRREIPGAALLVLPRTGHAINLEEPEAFNRALTEFFLAVEQARWNASRGA
ncbi:MAG: alpha/beta fold hydrolase [Rhodospirillales bacterium]